MSTATRKPWTAEELNRLPEGWRYEIDEGELVIMAPAGWRHGKVTNRVAFVISQFVYPQRLGEVLSGESGFFVRRAPDVLRAPDVAFYSTERTARVGNASDFTRIPPDLAVEVRDPSEPDLSRKVRQYLEAGVRAVWVVDPEARTLTRHAPGEPPRTWADGEAVVEEPVLPGFTCRLRDLFGEE
ncbi:Uma2 family endonuclease [Caldinitratiruptor microaerophilus]|uniref:Putative restriction endonuclease domain-containing protein n=1 Tax=Caldinitratiruptor microaerophilus TaxID=671077 RepID=A0AA35G7F2_9FIRM|nr:Uma2 family endonuclease [Caldinitratiruptor microaerophilus]BDG59795.1 hypothetical protein caldi_08850 [Caldinitratiruptor microaerophilus]